MNDAFSGSFTNLLRFAKNIGVLDPYNAWLCSSRYEVHLFKFTFVSKSSGRFPLMISWEYFWAPVSVSTKIYSRTKYYFF